MAAQLLQYLLQTAQRKHGAKQLDHHQLCQLQKVQRQRWRISSCSMPSSLAGWPWVVFAIRA
jgi:hypothetical protein